MAGEVAEGASMSYRRFGLILALACLLVASVGEPTATAGAPVARVAGARIIANCAKRSHPRVCRHRRMRLRAVSGYVSTFLGPVGACESGSHSVDLRSGLRAVSPGGRYRGRYQFGTVDWGRAGGVGDPASASWLEQAYRAVRWLAVNGRSSWPNC